MACGFFPTRIKLILQKTDMHCRQCCVMVAVQFKAAQAKSSRWLHEMSPWVWHMCFGSSLNFPSPSDHVTQGVVCRFKGKFSIFSLRYRVTYQAAWKLTSRTGLSSGFRDAALLRRDSEKKRRVYTILRLQVDWSPSFAQRAVNDHFNPCQQPFMNMHQNAADEKNLGNL